jgi:single-stranded-DNA-specific exonuclease
MAMSDKRNMSEQLAQLRKEAQNQRPWEVQETQPEAIQLITQSLNIPPLAAHLLINRGYNTPEQARKYLHSSFQDFANPAELQDCQKAALRILDAIAHQEKIYIYGDYDVDGVTSTALFQNILKDGLNYEVEAYIPHRLTEGYGLNVSAIEHLASQGAKLVITVDNGSAAIKEVARAKELGMDLIIVDHHQVSDPEPDAYAHLNPHRKTCPYPDKKLAAVGVSFMLLAEIKILAKQDPRFQQTKLIHLPLQNYFDIVALGTVADVAKLQDTNRIIVKDGLKKMRQHPRPGISALCEVSKIKAADISATHIGFKLGPRLNAGGRIDHANHGLTLLTSFNDQEVKQAADQVDSFNQIRQDLQDSILAEALEQAYQLSPDFPITVVANTEWHNGVVGIVAARLVEIFNKPAIVLGGDTQNTDILKGSARSIPQINIKDTLDAAQAVLLGYGGHVAAAGLSLKKENLEPLKTVLAQELRRQGYVPTGFAPLKIDAEVDLRNIDAKIVDICESMEPYGFGNSKPLFLARGVKARPEVLKEKHLKLYFNLPKEYPQEAILWGKADELDLFLNQSFDIVFTPEWNVWSQPKKIQLNMSSYKPSNQQ